MEGRQPYCWGTYQKVFPGKNIAPQPRPTTLMAKAVEESGKASDRRRWGGDGKTVSSPHQENAQQQPREQLEHEMEKQQKEQQQELMQQEEKQRQHQKQQQQQQQRQQQEKQQHQKQLLQHTQHQQQQKQQQEQQRADFDNSDIKAGKCLHFVPSL